MAVAKSSGPYSFNYTILDKDQKVIYTSAEDEAGSIVAATKNRDTIRDLYKDEELVGWLIIHNEVSELDEKINQYYAKMYMISYIAIIFLWGGYTVWIYFSVIRPFDKMRDFARIILTARVFAPDSREPAP